MRGTVPNSAAVAPIIIAALIFGPLVGIPLLVAWRQVRQDRRRIMTEGATGQAIITKIAPQSRKGSCVLHFSFQPSEADRTVQGKQRTTQAAIDKLGLMVGSTVEVRYLPKWPKFGFIDAVTLAERILPSENSSTAAITELSGSPSLFYVSFALANRFRWYGNGDVVIADPIIRFTAQQRRPFWFPKTLRRDFMLSSIVNVERFDATVRLEIVEPEKKVCKLQFLTANSAAAESIYKMLPSARTETYAPILAEGAAFNSALLAVTPNTPVTLVLIAVNVFLFLVATALGGGLFKVDPEVMIRLGTDYTPLTLTGQWWRLLTSIFLHFGLFHIALNMWALYLNGRVAERIFGSIRYLVIYMVAGLSGSVASLLWHPIVNGAGASGAIFGVLGAMIAFFLKREGGVPASVIKAQLTSVSIFVGYSLLNAARFQGIDNAAHVGGLVAGFAMGLILSRPLEADRNSKQWTMQWTRAFGLVGATTLVIAQLFATGALAPRLARDHDGRPIPLAALAPPIHSMGGFRLGMTSDEILRVKGPPIHDGGSAWVYNSIDPAHDGVVTVFFSRQFQSISGSVFAIEFTGHDKESAPSEMPYLNSFSTADVIEKYGEPISRRLMPDGTTFLHFRNGVYIGTRNDKVYRYGIFDIAQFRN
jgi:membrane associated rhomboid family serine protease